jgi:hypothetical protein
MDMGWHNPNCHCQREDSGGTITLTGWTPPRETNRKDQIKNGWEI